MRTRILLATVILTTISPSFQSKGKNFRVKTSFMRESQLAQPENYKGFATFFEKSAKKIQVKILLKNIKIKKITSQRFESIECTLQLGDNNTVRNPTVVTHDSNTKGVKQRLTYSANFIMNNHVVSNRFEFDKLHLGFSLKPNSPSLTQEEDFILDLSEVNLIDLNTYKMLNTNNSQYLLLSVSFISLALIFFSKKKRHELPLYTMLMFSLLCFSLNYVAIFTCSDLMWKADSCFLVHIWGVLGFFTLVFILRNLTIGKNIDLLSALVSLTFAIGFVISIGDPDYLPGCLFILNFSLIIEVLRGKDRDICFLTLLMDLCQIATYYQTYYYEYTSSLIPNNSETEFNFYSGIGCTLLALVCLIIIVGKKDPEKLEKDSFGDAYRKFGEANADVYIEDGLIFNKFY